MPKLTFVMGATASGKSYFITQHYAEQDVDIFNVYDYQMRAYDKAGFKEGGGLSFDVYFRCLRRANDEILADVKEKLAQGRDVVVEHTLYKAKRRIAYIDEIRKQPDVTIEFYVMCPGDALWASNLEKRGLGLQSSKREASEIEFPNPAEGIDAIYEVVDGEIRLRMDVRTPEILGPAREAIRAEEERIAKDDDDRGKKKALLERMNECKFWHYCEVCGKKEYLTAEEAFEGGWDYPPKMGQFGLLGPRTCGDCPMEDTLFWKVQTGGRLPVVCEGDLSPEELAVWHRIKGEPESLLPGCI